MISIYINQEQRPDVLIQTGGSLEQTSEHASSSDITIRVPADADPIKECDYIQIYDGDTIIYAGTVLKCEQEGFPITPPWRLYTLSLASNSDLVAGVYVDLGFPQGATITQILFGNVQSQSGYNSDLPQFRGIFATRIATEGVTLGQVDDFSSYVLDNPVYLWGQSVLNLLDELAEVAGAWWEITPNKVFNMQYSTNRPECPFNLTQQSDVFDLSVSSDALTFYSACRVVGGQGEVIASNNGAVSVLPNAPSNSSSNSQYIVWKDEQTLVSNLPLAKIGVIRQAPYSSEYPAAINVGYSGINDDDPDYQALMSYGGTEIALKDGVGYFLNPSISGNSITCINTYFLTDVFARFVDQDLAKEISDNRGGSGIVEYSLEDSTITSFSAAVAAAMGFLASYAKKAEEISFSTFLQCEAGQQISCNLPYYSVFGDYQITKVSTEFVLDTDNQIIAKRSVTASNIPYRDPYKALWNVQSKVTFSLESDSSPQVGYTIANDIKLKTYITAYTSELVSWSDIQIRVDSWNSWENTYKSWQMLQSATTPYLWEEIQEMYTSWSIFEQKVKTWGFLEQLEEMYFSMSNSLTPLGRANILDLLNGKEAVPVNVFGNMIALVYDPNDQSVSKFGLVPQDSLSLGNGGITTFYVSPDDLPGIIQALTVQFPGYQEAFLSAPVNIDHTGTGAAGKFALTLSVRTTVE